MGLVLDSSVLIAAERENGQSVGFCLRLALANLQTNIVISSITVMELEHGWQRQHARSRAEAYCFVSIAKSVTNWRR